MEKPLCIGGKNAIIRKNKKRILDVCFVKYGTWNVARYDPTAQGELCAAGYSPLTAAVLSSRGCATPREAAAYLQTDAPLCDPMLLRDMDKAAARVRQALDAGEQIAVFGDYDVDGITATCLLTDYLRSLGGRVIPYIPARIEEGYGLNETALTALAEQGVTLVVSVDCGITADEEALFCRSRGMDLVITDHHECKAELPQAAAVVDPHRKDHTYPHQDLAGVGVAFKLAAAIEGDQTSILDRYCDLVCLGTVADVMPLQGENRTMVARGLEAMTARPRVGLRALMTECGCADQPVTASLIGYTLAPRINAAGRMGEVGVAMELFLTDDPARAAHLAGSLCRMNRRRQSVEAEIYQDAVSQLNRSGAVGDAIILSGEDWHQGVVGIVASRLAEEYCCPTFLICMDGEKGKASSRSYGGFQLFGALGRLSSLLESYGGHELAAGFTILRSNIDEFRSRMQDLVREFQTSGQSRLALEVDCEVAPGLLSIPNVDGLEELEPCGAGCPRPVLSMTGVTVEQLSAVGGGKHLRLRLRKNGYLFHAIFFSTTAASACVAEGDTVEIAFQPQINEYRGNRSVQLNLVDIRPPEDVRTQQTAEQDLYRRVTEELPLTKEESALALPSRQEFADLWRYLDSAAEHGALEDTPEHLARLTARRAGTECGLLRTQICMDVLEELGLLQTVRSGKLIRITLHGEGKKVNLDSSRILSRLRQAGESHG